MDFQTVIAMDETQRPASLHEGTGPGTGSSCHSVSQPKNSWSILHRVPLARLVGSGYTSVEGWNMLAENKKWEQLYEQAVMEGNSEKMPERIVATREAIAGRLRDLEHDSDHHSERRRIEDALYALTVLEREMKER